MEKHAQAKYGAGAIRMKSGELTSDAHRGDQELGRVRSDDVGIYGKVTEDRV